MWVFDWWKKRKKKRAFRVIRSQTSWNTMAHFPLSFPKLRTITKVQFHHSERIIEKHEKQLQMLQPIKMQVVHMHLPLHERKQVEQPFLKKHRLRDEQEAFAISAKAILRKSYQEERDYFRSRPTLARSMMQDMMQARPYQKLSKDRVLPPIHLEILRQAAQPILEATASESRKPVVTTAPYPIITDQFILTLVQEVLKQMRKEAWRKGDGSWKK